MRDALEHLRELTTRQGVTLGIYAGRPDYTAALFAAGLVDYVGLGIDLPQERGGLLPTRDWKGQRFGSAWSQGETVICGIGQGYVLSTPLQLAVMAARIANGGRAVVPRLALEASRADRLPPPPEPASLGLNPAHLKVVQDGMINVVNSARGTAKGAAIHEAGGQRHRVHGAGAGAAHR